MRTSRLALALGVLLACGPASRAQDKGGGPGPAAKPAGDPKVPLPARINKAIEAGVRFLMDTDKKDKQLIMSRGNWNDEVTGNRVYEKTGADNIWCDPTGCTSLALYALLKSGVSKDDPIVKKAFQWLKTGRSNCVYKGSYVVPNEVPNGTYEISVLVLALEAKANPHKREAERERDLRFRLKKGEKLDTGVKLEAGDQAWMKKLLDALVKRQNKGAAWRYANVEDDGKVYNGIRGVNDLSASQLAMLALLAGERCGFKQPDQLYADVLQWTLGNQEKDGPERTRWDPSAGKGDDSRYGLPKDHARGFGYLGITGADEENRATGSMTSCGLANILIASGILEARESKLFTPALQAQVEKAWWDGVAWMDEHWSVTTNVNRKGYPYHYYFLYCMERACDLKRINLLAGHPWYVEGAQVLVDQQDPSGAWTKQDTHLPCDVLNTCFALLFLNRATPAITAGD
jgi:hypothetical protein